MARAYPLSVKRVAIRGSYRRRSRQQRWRVLLFGLAALTVVVAVAGHGIPGASTALRPRFDDLSQYIRYHPSFHDGHSHDGYGHGFHGGTTRHVHDADGNPTHPPYVFPMLSNTQGQPPVSSQPDGHSPLGLTDPDGAWGMGEGSSNSVVPDGTAPISWVPFVSFEPPDELDETP